MRVSAATTDVQVIRARLAAYRAYVDDPAHDAPPFCPRDGVCYKCRKQVFAKTADVYPTGCPWCCYSFCE